MRSSSHNGVFQTKYKDCFSLCLDGLYIFVFSLQLFKNKFIYFIYLFLAALGLRCCVRAFSSCGEQGLLFVVCRLLIAVASLVADHRL